MIASMSKASARFSDERRPVFDISQQGLIGIPRLAPPGTVCSSNFSTRGYRTSLPTTRSSLQRHTEIRALVGGRIWNPIEPHVSPHLLKRAPFVFHQPGLKVGAQRAQVARAVPHKSRHHLHGVGPYHRGLHHVEDVVDAPRNREGSY